MGRCQLCGSYTITAEDIEKLRMAHTEQGQHVDPVGEDGPAGEEGVDALKAIKQDIAREIFAEIENVLNQRVQLYYTISVTTFDSIEQAKSMASESTLRAFRDYIAELKKKYTEVETDESAG